MFLFGQCISFYEEKGQAAGDCMSAILHRFMDWNVFKIYGLYGGMIGLCQCKK